MSGVYAKDRKLSDFEFYNLALKIKVEVNRLVLRESVIPKRYRITNAVPLIEMARSCVYNINRADQFYPNSPQNVIDRRRYLSLAIADAEQLCLELQSLVEMGLPVDVNKLLPIAAMVDREVGLLKGARKAVRLVGKRTPAELLADAEAEVERLRGVQ
jgi:hypothetical protein